MKKAVATVMGLAMITATCFGSAIEADTMELGLNGNMDFQNAEGDLAYGLNASLGYFIVDNIEAGGMMALGYNGSDFGYGIGPFGEVNFDIDLAVMPYLAGRITYNFGDYFIENHLNIEGAAGLKVFISETVAVAGEIFYDLANKEVYLRDNDLHNDHAGIRLGVRSFF